MIIGEWHLSDTLLLTGIESFFLMKQEQHTSTCQRWLDNLMGPIDGFAIFHSWVLTNYKSTQRIHRYEH
jgi:hypothetical protein